MPCNLGFSAHAVHAAAHACNFLARDRPWLSVCELFKLTASIAAGCYPNRRCCRPSIERLALVLLRTRVTWKRNLHRVFLLVGARRSRN